MTQEKLQMVASVLSQSDSYRGKKESDYSSRFDFKEYEDGSISVFNAEKGNNLFIWVELYGLVNAMGLSCYITFDQFDLQQVILRIY